MASNISLKNDFLVNGFEIVTQLYEEKKLNPLLSSNATINYTCAKYFKENDENIEEKMANFFTTLKWRKPS